MKAKYEGIEIKLVIRWARNGHCYTWNNPSIKILNQLISKYGVDQVGDDGTLWLQR